MKFIVFGHGNKDTEAGVIPSTEEFATAARMYSGGW